MPMDLVAVVAGSEEKQYDYIGVPEFSPDSRHVAIPAQTDTRWCIVVDGIEGKWYDAVGDPASEAG